MLRFPVEPLFPFTGGGPGSVEGGARGGGSIRLDETLVPFEPAGIVEGVASLTGDVSDLISSAAGVFSGRPFISSNLGDEQESKARNTKSTVIILRLWVIKKSPRHVNKRYRASRKYRLAPLLLSYPIYLVN